MTTDYGLRLDARFSLAETGWAEYTTKMRENAKLRPQTTDKRLRTKIEGQLYTKQTQMSLKKIRDALVLSCNRRTAIQNVIAREACVQA